MRNQQEENLTLSGGLSCSAIVSRFDTKNKQTDINNATDSSIVFFHLSLKTEISSFRFFLSHFLRHETCLKVTTTKDPDRQDVGKTNSFGGKCPLTKEQTVYKSLIFKHRLLSLCLWHLESPTWTVCKW